ncbi:MAG TPA: endonuclease/exonuclease/phosphatase family protein [Nocardioides sp.]|nr:endonuclease/exonuclease/phosphatase family protein [Nocardioides sp.]
MTKDGRRALRRTRPKAVAVGVLALAFTFLVVAGATGLVGAPGKVVDASYRATLADESRGPVVSDPTQTPDPLPTARPTAKPQQVVRAGKALARVVETPEPELPDVEIPTTAEFTVSSFNVLGASHSDAGGTSARFSSGETRMGYTVQLLRQYGIDVVGFQEFETEQYNSFKRQTGAEYGVYPGPALGRNSIRNSIAWRTDTWELVSGNSIPIPYFSGSRVKMPYIRLRHLASGQEVWFINVHNPASTKRHPGNERWRDMAAGMEINLVNRLRNETGLPVILTGDFNEREEAFCRITAQASVQAANGGSSGDGGCRRPDQMGIDWIFGSLSIAFSNYARHDDGLVSRASDHPMIVADAVIG